MVRTVRLEQTLVDHLLGDRRADVDVVGHVVLAGQGLDRVHLVGRRGVGVGDRVLDIGVLLAERGEDALVVGPVVGQGDQVDLATLGDALLVQRLEVAPVAAVVGGCRRSPRPECRGLLRPAQSVSSTGAVVSSAAGVLSAVGRMCVRIVVVVAACGQHQAGGGEDGECLPRSSDLMGVPSLFTGGLTFGT